MKITLTSRKETPEQWDTNKKLNEATQTAFWNSVKLFEGDNRFFPTITTKQILKSYNYQRVDYGSSNLEKSGCAVFTFHQGLRLRGIEVSILDLTREIATKGYYEDGKGTYHNLFDHYGLRRATHVFEIFNALEQKHLITLLVSNSRYRFCSVQGSHFVNIVGKTKTKFRIDDPELGRINMDIEKLLKSIDICWIW